MSTSGASRGSILFQGFRRGETFANGDLAFEMILSRVPGGCTGFSEVKTLHIYTNGPVACCCSFGIAGATSGFHEAWKPVGILTWSVSGTPQFLSIMQASCDGMQNEFQGDLFSLGHATRHKPGRSRGTRPYAEDALYTMQFLQREPPLDAKPAITVSQPYKSLTNDNNDVAFVFPFEKASRNGVLWASKAKLTALSPYFEAMLTGGFTESDNILLETSHILNATQRDLSKIKADERRKGRPTDIIHSDSDIEDDDNSMETENDEVEQETEEPSASSAIHYVTIRETSYKTYEGLLEWAYSGKIGYAPLRSTHPTSFSPKPSPKSIFRLAHQLGIKVLEDDAVANFKSQLDHKNVLEELFSSTCFAYPVLRDAGLKVLERDWAKVKESGGLDGVFKLLESEQGDSKEMTRMALEILKRAPKLGQ